jgi:hypothetical protein
MAAAKTTTATNQQNIITKITDTKMSAETKTATVNTTKTPTKPDEI